MQFDPKWVFYLGLLVTIETAIGQGSVSLTNVIPIEWAPYVKAWCSLLSFIGTAVMTAMSAYSSKASGPLVNTKPPVTPAIAVLIGAGMLMAMLMSGSTANAQPKFPPLPLKAPASANGDLGSILDKLAAKGTADLQAADDLASAINPDTNQVNDAIAHACYPALIKFINALPKPPADGSPPGPALLFERARMTRKLVQSGLPDYLKIGCAPLVQDEAHLFIRVLALVGVAVGTGGLSLPALPGLLPALPVL